MEALAFDNVAHGLGPPEDTRFFGLLQESVEGRQGIGTFVLRRPDGPPAGTHMLLARGLATWIAKARKAGMRDADIESMVRSTLMATTSEEATA